MNIEEYISSGILEAYVLGELSEGERRDVENKLARHPELRSELDAIERAQEEMLMRAAIPPPVALREKILAAAGHTQGGKEVALHAGASSSVWKYAAAAALTLAIISSFLAYNYREKWLSASSELTALATQNQRIARDYNQVNQRLDQIENDLEVIGHPDMERVVMKGTDNAPTALASVYWNPSTREVYLKVQDMKTLSADRQYQLWAIIDGKPVDAGVFDAEDRSMLRMKGISGKAQMFAVTIEPRGGKSSPTLSTMQVAGEVQG